MPDQERRRLNSWKEISAYVGRDVRTVSRWEKQRGLPVYRLPGGGRSVFAYADEIDAWLTGGDPDARETDSPPARPSRRSMALALAGIAAVVASMAIWAPRMWSSPAPVASVDVQGSEVIALSADAAPVWRYRFPYTIRWPFVHPRYATEDVDGNGDAEVFTIVGRPDAQGIDLDAVVAFDHRGRLLWERSVTDAVRFRDRAYEGPWSSGPLAVVRMDSGWRVAWVTHHNTWWPSIVALFDGRGTRVGSFVHAGWITSIAAARDGHVIVAGVANHADADVVAVLDAQSWPGAGPQPTGTEYECVRCPEGRPLRYFLLPRSELNLRPDKLRQAKIHVFDWGIQVRVAHSDGLNPSETIYELGGDYRLRSIRSNDAHAAWHRRLETTGAIRHSVDDCPERRGTVVREWDRTSGWQERRLGAVE